MKLGRRPRKWLDKKSKLGFRGFPIGTIAFYGPDAQLASKVVVAVIAAPDTEPVASRKWFAESGDVRNNAATFEEIALFLRGHEVRTVAMTEGMMGCPHEEGIDYPEGQACPDCPYWAGRDRPVVVWPAALAREDTPAWRDRLSQCEAGAELNLTPDDRKF